MAPPYFEPWSLYVDYFREQMQQGHVDMTEARREVSQAQREMDRLARELDEALINSKVAFSYLIFDTFPLRPQC